MEEGYEISKLQLLKSRYIKLAGLIITFSFFLGYSSGATEFLDPLEDYRAEWNCTGCQNNHFSVLNDSVRSSSVPDKSDYIYQNATGNGIDIHGVGETSLIDTNWVSLWFYADTGTKNFDLNVELRNDSKDVKSGSFTAQGEKWYKINWTVPSNPTNLTALFNSTKNGSGVSEVGEIYSWYIEISGRLPDIKPPIWRNQVQENQTVKVGESNKLSAQAKDSDSGLKAAKLSTNESGSWKNETGQKLTAAFSSSDGAPKCGSSEIWSCNTGSLIESADSYGGNGEKNSPNTIDGSKDGSSGSYLTDSSVEEIDISSANGSKIENGEWLEVNITSYVNKNHNSDVNLNLAYSNSTGSPGWEVVGGVSSFSTGGNVSKSFKFKLDDKDGEHAVRALIERSGKDSRVSCEDRSTNDYCDNDDLVFEVSESEDYYVNFEGSKSYEWANITWLDTSINDEKTVGWKMWFGDQKSNWNVTEKKSFAVSRPDLEVSNIYVNNTSDLKENKFYNFTAEIQNIGKIDSGSFKTQINLTSYNGSHKKLVKNLETQESLNAGEKFNMSLGWKSSPGPYFLVAKPDYNNKITELSEKNNKESRSIDISSYQVFYGGSDINVRLQTTEANFTSYSPESGQGRIYFSDIDSEYVHDDLIPLNNSGDLSEADDALNLTGHNDSLSEEFDDDGDGLSDVFSNISVSGDVLEVPVIDSTVSSSFKTGILYDSSDGYPYDGDEDLVFVSPLNHSKTGKYGTYDYEAKVPSNLKSLDQPTDKVRIFLGIGQ